MLDLFSAAPSGISSGMVKGSLLNGQYRVMFRGRDTVATSQSGMLAPGQKVTLADTPDGLVVVSAGAVSANTHVEVLING